MINQETHYRPNDGLDTRHFYQARRLDLLRPISLFQVSRYDYPMTRAHEATALVASALLAATVILLIAYAAR